MQYMLACQMEGMGRHRDPATRWCLEELSVSEEPLFMAGVHISYYVVTCEHAVVKSRSRSRYRLHHYISLMRERSDLPRANHRL